LHALVEEAKDAPRLISFAVNAAKDTDRRSGLSVDFIVLIPSLQGGIESWAKSSSDFIRDVLLCEEKISDYENG
jgi:hypothetical protein